MPITFSDVLSYEDMKALILAHLNYGYSNSPYWIKDVRSGDAGMEVIYQSWQDSVTYVRTFEILADNEIKLGPPQEAVQRTVYDTVKLSTTCDLSAPVRTFSSGDESYVVRKGKIFEAGSHVDGNGQSFVMTEDELATAVAAFKPVSLDNNHLKDQGSIFTQTMAGKLGSLDAVSVGDDRKTLFGEVRVPKWLDDAVGNASLKVSTTWDKTTKQLTGLALTTSPVIEDAELLTAFAKFAGARHSAKDIKDIQALHDNAHTAHDLLVGQGATCEAKMSTEDLPMTPEEEKGFFQRMKDHIFGTAAVPAPVPTVATAPVAAPAVAAPVMVATQPVETENEKALKAQLETERKARIASEASAFADGEINACRALPAERAAIVADFSLAAEDDAGTPTELKFSVSRTEGDKLVTEEKTGGRVDALKARYGLRAKHSLTSQVVPSNLAILSTDPTGETPEAKKKRKAELMAKTPIGKAAAKQAAKEAQA